MQQRHKKLWQHKNTLFTDKKFAVLFDMLICNNDRNERRTFEIPPYRNYSGPC